MNETLIDKYLEDIIKDTETKIQQAKPLCRKGKNTILPHLYSKLKAYKEIYKYINSSEYMKQEFLDNIKNCAKEYYR